MLFYFAGGVLILLFRPFKVGDVIEAQGFTGIVKVIQIFNTVMNTFDNKRIIIPNGAISSGPITNYTAEDIRRVDMEFGIGYGDDIKKAKKVLSDLIAAETRILHEPAEPFLALKELGESSVNFVIRVWAKAEDYWGIYFDMQENVKLTFDKEGISIPFPQRDALEVVDLDVQRGVAELVGDRRIVALDAGTRLVHHRHVAAR